ncbi:hypothetical protein P5G86_02180 [Paenibacillus jamilae]|uniref:Uncharacterized protein n=1 Tax=Bacillus thuringiensis serovar subtoxicus TaxID=475791 RepID=A0A9X6II54_BACTU|nr:hypothetical protein [Bacillus thuringiensis]MEB4838908.1 hypothetical protein [Paenibacillus jamilae]MEB8578809.1 hypothetical protein [Bacillus cereus]MCR6855380.1 hypothetical protein [Bacillus thuringiensis]MDR4283099.1 hypothetical protein [Bacillus thuringiensis]MEB8592221.1 hypothetical protein [Bacillus cereus]
MKEITLKLKLNRKQQLAVICSLSSVLVKMSPLTEEKYDINTILEENAKLLSKEGVGANYNDMNRDAYRTLDDVMEELAKEFIKHKSKRAIS